LLIRIEKYLIEFSASKNKKEQNKEKDKESDDLAVVLYDFTGTNCDELIFNKDDFLFVTNWNIRDGWATGYKRNNPQKKRNFLSALIRKYFENLKILKVCLYIYNIIYNCFYIYIFNFFYFI